MNGGRGKSRETNGYILGALRPGRAVLHPFMPGNQNRFSGPDIKIRLLDFYMQHTF